MSNNTQVKTFFKLVRIEKHVLNSGNMGVLVILKRITLFISLISQVNSAPQIFFDQFVDLYPEAARPHPLVTEAIFHSNAYDIAEHRSTIGTSTETSLITSPTLSSVRRSQYEKDWVTAPHREKRTKVRNRHVKNSSKTTVTHKDQNHISNQDTGELIINLKKQPNWITSKSQVRFTSKTPNSINRRSDITTPFITSDEIPDTWDVTDADQEKQISDFISMSGVVQHYPLYPPIGQNPFNTWNVPNKKDSTKNTIDGNVEPEVSTDEWSTRNEKRHRGHSKQRNSKRVHIHATTDFPRHNRKLKSHIEIESPTESPWNTKHQQKSKNNIQFPSSPEKLDETPKHSGRKSKSFQEPSDKLNSFGNPLNSPFTQNYNPPDNWEVGLREATYRAMTRDRVGDPSLKKSLRAASIVNRNNNGVSKFGDIAVVARGQLYVKGPYEYEFVQDHYPSDCEDCLKKKCVHKKFCDGLQDRHEESLVALWAIKRVRHRDIQYGQRYEFHYTISPKKDAKLPLLDSKGRFDYSVPGHLFIVKTKPQGAARTSKQYEPSSSIIQNRRDQQYLPPDVPQKGSYWVHRNINHAEPYNPQNEASLNTGEYVDSINGHHIYTNAPNSYNEFSPNFYNEGNRHFAPGINAAVLIESHNIKPTIPTIVTSDIASHHLHHHYYLKDNQFTNFTPDYDDYIKSLFYQTVTPFTQYKVTESEETTQRTPHSITFTTQGIHLPNKITLPGTESDNDIFKQTSPFVRRPHINFSTPVTAQTLFDNISSLFKVTNPSTDNSVSEIITTVTPYYENIKHVSLSTPMHYEKNKPFKFPTETTRPERPTTSPETINVQINTQTSKFKIYEVHPTVPTDFKASPYYVQYSPADPFYQSSTRPPVDSQYVTVSNTEQIVPTTLSLPKPTSPTYYDLFPSTIHNNGDTITESVRNTEGNFLKNINNYPDSINAQLPPPEKGTDTRVPYVASTIVTQTTPRETTNAISSSISENNKELIYTKITRPGTTKVTYPSSTDYTSEEINFSQLTTTSESSKITTTTESPKKKFIPKYQSKYTTRFNRFKPALKTTTTTVRTPSRFTPGRVGYFESQKIDTTTTTTEPTTTKRTFSIKFPKLRPKFTVSSTQKPEKESSTNSEINEISTKPNESSDIKETSVSDEIRNESITDYLKNQPSTPKIKSIEKNKFIEPSTKQSFSTSISFKVGSDENSDRSTNNEKNINVSNTNSEEYSNLDPTISSENEFNDNQGSLEFGDKIQPTYNSEKEENKDTPYKIILDPKDFFSPGPIDENTENTEASDKKESFATPEIQSTTTELTNTNFTEEIKINNTTENPVVTTENKNEDISEPIKANIYTVNSNQTEYDIFKAELPQNSTNSNDSNDTNVFDDFASTLIQHAQQVTLNTKPINTNTDDSFLTEK